MLWLALATLLWTSPASAAMEDPTLTEVTACAQLAVPDTPRVWSIAFTSRTRAGARRDVRANIFTRHDDLGRRVVVLRVTRPADLEGSTLLLLEREGPNEIFFSSPELEQPVRITADGAPLSLFGTDFSYEDVERMYGLNRPVESRRLDDALVGDQPVHVVESKPAGGLGESAYESVVAFIAKDTCVPLRTEFYVDRPATPQGAHDRPARAAPRWYGLDRPQPPDERLARRVGDPTHHTEPGSHHELPRASEQPVALLTGSGRRARPGCRSR